MAGMDLYDRPGSALSDDSDKSENADMWSSMLSSVASSKRLPQKSMVVLGTHTALALPGAGS